MSPFQCCAALLAAALLGGCASAPEQVAENAAADASATVDAAVTRADAGLEPVVVEINARDLDPGLVVTCRQMLKPASNVIVTQCMTRDDWERFERQQALWARQMLRRMQGSAFP